MQETKTRGGIVILSPNRDLAPSVPESKLIRISPRNYRRKGARETPEIPGMTNQRKILRFLRDRVHKGIPRAYYKAVLGHDLHASLFATLTVRHFHTNERDPFTGEPGGWWEDLGLVSEGLVTSAFVDFMVDQLQAESSEFGDFKFHRVGTDNTAESNAHTALQTDSGITGATGSQTEGATSDIYRTVGTVTADASETWQEHGVFSQAGTTSPAGTMLDRNLISPTVAVVSSDQVQFTYDLTVNPET